MTQGDVTFGFAHTCARVAAEPETVSPGVTLSPTRPRPRRQNTVGGEEHRMARWVEDTSRCRVRAIGRVVPRR